MDVLGTGSNILLILLGFGLLIALHELGHFLAARWAGIRADGFAIGMGPVVLSYRRGVGVRFGSCDEVVRARSGRLPIEMSDRELAEAGLGETEYSLRLLPIGGFVKMLGQEDGNPGATSNDPRSYGRTPVGKRMIVVSAGVAMNLVTAVIMFVIAFMIGVRFEAPIVGAVAPGSPAAAATASVPIPRPVGDGIDFRDVTPADLVPSTADDSTEFVHLEPGDRIVAIDGKPVLTFSDIMIESAMSVPGRPLRVEVVRPGVDRPLEFEIEPTYDERSNMRMIGVAPASSTRLADDDVLIDPLTRIVGPELAATLPGREAIEAGGSPITSWDQLEADLEAARGEPVDVVFGPREDRPEDRDVQASLAAEPLFETMPDPTSEAGSAYGLLGLAPLVRIDQVPAGGRNEGVVLPGDVVLEIAGLSAPRMDEFRQAIMDRPGQTIPMVVLRDGNSVAIEVRTDSDGRIGVMPGYALELPVTARPVVRTGESIDASSPTPIAPLSLLPRTRIDEVGGRVVTNWSSMRRAFLEATANAAGLGEPAEVSIVTTLPLPEAMPTESIVRLSVDDVRRLHALGWTAPLPAYWFEPVQTTLTADGNPLVAASMGFRQTWRMVVLTYLTIDRLIGGSVSVKQLHGPVGIVHIGTKVADRGSMYLLFFLAMISVNLAVLNFLPLPIVDGGLFLFLVYEKIRGRPPSIAFQNIATLLGLALIGTLFVVTFFNDVMRLAGGQ